MTARRRLVRPTGPLADRKREEDELAQLIVACGEDDSRAAKIARRILDAGYTRRVVVDDAMVERAANAYRHVAHPLLVDNHAMHAALTAALGTDR